MQDALLRAQHYLQLALQMHKTATLETNPERRSDLIELAEQYERLGTRLVDERAEFRVH